MTLTMAHYRSPFFISFIYFYLALPLRSFDVGPINLSACGRYTIDCGILPIQNTKADRTEVASCTLSVSCLSDLDNCVVFVDGVGVFLEHVHRTYLPNPLRQTSPLFLFMLLVF